MVLTRVDERLITTEGTVYWYDSEGNNLQRKKGPAVIYPSGTVAYYIGNKLNREEDKPSIIFDSGIVEYYKNNKLHRIGKPAKITPDGEQRWFKNNLLHCIKGPAVIHADGRKEYWINGKQLSSLEIFARHGHCG